jgi:membrane protein YqaA with SNARE-associated domain
MIIVQIIAAAAPTAARSLRRWIFHLGGLGLIPLGLLDSSLIPVPGSLDVVTILLAAREQEWWFYYALMATAGSVIGAYFTYRLGRRGGKATLERRFRRRQVDNVHKIFERWGFGAIAIPALLPPPVPMVPFVLAAGAMQYPMKKFLAAFMLGRIVRYSILAYLAARYGRKIIAFIAENGHPVALTVIGLLLATALTIFLFWRGSMSKKPTAS